MQNWTLLPLFKQSGFLEPVGGHPRRPPSEPWPLSARPAQGSLPVEQQGPLGRSAASCSQETACRSGAVLGPHRHSPCLSARSGPSVLPGDGASEDWSRCTQMHTLVQLGVSRRKSHTAKQLVGQTKLVLRKRRCLYEVVSSRTNPGVDSRAEVARREFYKLLLFLIPAFCFVL